MYDFEVILVVFCNNLYNRTLYYTLSISCILTSSVYPAEASKSPNDQHGHTPLHTVAAFGHSEVASRLLADERVDVNEATTEGYTPLPIKDTQDTTPLHTLVDITPLPLFRDSEVASCLLDHEGQNDM